MPDQKGSPKKTAMDLMDYYGEDRIVFSNELFTRLREERKDMEVNIHSRYFPDLSQAIGGFEGGEMIILSGYTGHGKTTLAKSFTKDFCEQGYVPLWFSYEMQAYHFLNKFGQHLPMFTMPNKMVSKSSTWLEDRCHEAVLKHNVNVVFIDHLHFLVDMIHRNASLEIGSIVRQVKLIAIRYNLIIFLIAHTTKPLGDARELELGATRDSSFIEQEADTVIYTWRSKDRENVGTIKVAKDRKNGTFDKKFEVIHSNGIFKESYYQ